MHGAKKVYAGGRVSLLGSFPGVETMPSHDLPEVAFAGRSNVGKSSAINRILDVRGLARVSRTPGRTQLVNLFLVGDRYVLADLPGYGFAKVPEEVREAWKPMIEGYLAARRQLRLVVMVVDARLALQPMDADLLWGLRQARIPVTVLATKADKLKRAALDRQVALLRREMALAPDRLIAFSAADGTGVEAVRAVLEGL